MDNKEINVAFGNFIREAREKQGLYQETVASRTGLSQSYYARIERGERSCYFPTALQICYALSVDINDFHESLTKKTP